LFQDYALYPRIPLLIIGPTVKKRSEPSHVASYLPYPPISFLTHVSSLLTHLPYSRIFLTHVSSFYPRIFLTPVSSLLTYLLTPVSSLPPPYLSLLTYLPYHLSSLLTYLPYSLIFLTPVSSLPSYLPYPLPYPLFTLVPLHLISHRPILAEF